MVNKLLPLLLIALLFSCGNNDDKIQKDKSGEKINVLATTNQVADLVKIIGGDKVNVEGLLGRGVDPHLYKASESDVSKMYEADVIAYNGLHLEGKMDEVFDKMENTKTVFAVSDGIDRNILIKAENSHEVYDPHFWLDVQLWKQAAKYTAEKLIEFDPENAEIYTNNYEKYSVELDSLHEYIIINSQKIPKEKRVIITAHDAFEYYGRAYDFRVKGLQGITTTQKAGAADVQKLADFIVENKIPSIFVETSVSEKSIVALVEAVNSKGYKTEKGKPLYTDSLGNPGTFEGTYIGMMKYNTDVIVNALKR